MSHYGELDEVAEAIERVLDTRNYRWSFARTLVRRMTMACLCELLDTFEDAKKEPERERCQRVLFIAKHGDSPVCDKPQPCPDHKP